MPKPGLYILVFFILMAIVRYFFRGTIVRNYSRLPASKKASIEVNYTRMIRIYTLLFKLSPAILVAGGMLATYVLAESSLLTAAIIVAIVYLFIVEDYFFRKGILAGL